MPVFIWQEGALEKMAEIEGERWLGQQLQSGDCSFVAFLIKWKVCEITEEKLEEIRHTMPGVYQYYLKNLLTFRGNASIYGVNGGNRYHVNYAGEIFFNDAINNEKEQLAKVKEVGFRMLSELT